MTPFLSGITAVSPETLRVLAVMVDFVADEDPLTTGNGRFDTTTTPSSVIDPPPHDRAYFRNHLLFLTNYWRSVTNGKLIVAADLVDTVVHLPQSMRYYSPPSASTTNRELGLLIHDAWRHVDSLRDSIDFRQYQAFCIFHAGVGRDIDLTSLLGYDPTPWDIPSLYMDSTSLRRAMGANYRGVPLRRDTTYFISNSMILPEAESRLLPSAGGQSLLQLGINGLLAASLGSYIGLPDLFDTRTGRSAIGRFGLMDGQAIFSWNGVFPPEPSAWEKIFLKQRGFFDSLLVIDAPPGEKGHRLPAATLSVMGSDTILRVPISSQEYFLVENRNRDARRDSAQIWIAQGNTQPVRKTYFRDTVGFDAYDQRSFGGGVVVDVDEFDWSLPGGVSSSGEFFDGGVLIWHIDESVINAGYASNAVNADPNRRGVDLEEADGSQDLGQSYGFVSPGSGSEAGTALDFWYAGNSAPVYRNTLSLNTYPSSLSNRGANSHITIQGFSVRGSVMTFQTQLGDSLATPIAGYPRFVGRPRGDNSPQFERAVFITTGDSIFTFKPDSGVSATPDARGLFSTRGGQYPVALLARGSDTTVVVGVQDSTLLILIAVDNNGDGVFERVDSTVLKFPNRLTTAPMIARRSDTTALYMSCVGDASGTIHLASLDTTLRHTMHVGSSPISSIGTYVAKANLVDSIVTVSGDILWKENGGTFVLPHASSNWQIASLGEQFAVTDVGGSSLILLDGNFTPLFRKTFVEIGGLSPVAIADVDADGNRDVVFAGGRNLNALNLTGASLDYFPVTLPKPIVGAPIITRLHPNSVEAQIFVTTTDGIIYGIDSRGRPISGFPLAVGGINRSAPTAFALPTGPSIKTAPALFVSDSSGYLSAWRLQGVIGSPAFPWSSFRGNPSHTARDSSRLVSVPQPSEFLPSARAYNWPNPVYDGKTFIRYYLKNDASVRITILDLDGEIVDEFAGPGNGGLDNEVEWDASNVQSGVYFGHIEAHAGGQSGVAIIKIAIVK